MRYARALFSTDRLAHGAAELPRVISLHGQNFRGRADLLGIDNFNLQRLTLRLFLAHVSDKLGNLNPRLTVPFFSSSRWQSNSSPSVTGAMLTLTRSGAYVTTFCAQSKSIGLFSTSEETRITVSPTRANVMPLRCVEPSTKTRSVAKCFTRA